MTWPLFHRMRAALRPYPQVATAFTVLGDIHGRDDLLLRGLDRLPPRRPLICLGDMIDRGPNSAGVLRHLIARPDTLCLMGNHEEMMLAFLDDPEGEGVRWLENGGTQTLQSYGVDPFAPPVKAREALRGALPSGLLAWLRGLPSLHRSGDLLLTHAGADPDQAPEDQPIRALHWGHRNFGRRTRADRLWVVHGHTIVPTPRVRRRIISIDTGAWMTDRLTMAHFDPGGAPRFEEA